MSAREGGSHPQDVARRRVVLGLGAAAVAAAGAAAASLAPPSAPRQRVEVGGRVLPDFAGRSDDAALIMVTAVDEFYHIVKDPDGWVLPEKGRYPVRSDRIAMLIEGLSDMTYARPMTRDPKKFDRIGLGDPAEGGAGAFLEVGDGRGTSFAKMLVGYRSGQTYVRDPHDLQAWAVTNGDLPPLHRAALWLDLAVVDIAAADIADVEVRVGLSGYRLTPSDEAGGAFVLAPPHQGRLAPGFALTSIAQALTRFAPVDVAPADSLGDSTVSAIHTTRLKSGVRIATQAFRAPDARGADRGWVRLAASVEDGADDVARAQAAALMQRAAPWAFGLSELEWGALATPLEQLALR